MLPIQRKPGRPWTIIDRSFQYPLSPEVQTSEWSKVPQNVREWSLSIWRDEFKLQRDPLGPDDIFAWIRGKGVLAMKRGRWIGQTESCRVAYVCFNYVDRAWRGNGYSQQLICSLGNFATGKWGPIPFIFEIQHSVPSSLQDIPPLVRFTYMWIPFLYTHTPPRWMPISLDVFESLPGFHPDEKEGYRAFGHDGKKILLDPHNDIIHYDDVYSLLSFDGLPIPGGYVRVFTPLGTSSIFIQNMYYDPMPSFKSFVMG